MKSKHRVIVVSFTVILFFFFGCTKNKKTTIITKEGLRAEGSMNKDSLFEGEVNFFDVSSNKLVSKRNYVNGLLNGTRTDYFSNRKTAIVGLYENGKKNEFLYFFNKNGDTSSVQYFYYDIPFGSTIFYKNNKVKTYKFYSFENELLLDIEYDSLKLKKLADVTEGLFLWFSKDFSILKDDSLVHGNTDYFIYTPSPPSLDFEYSLVLIDSAYNLKQTIETFDSKKQWHMFSIYKKEKLELRYAIRLSFFDKANDDKVIMFKKID